MSSTRQGIQAAAGDQPALLFVDAPLVVANPPGQRECERQLGQRSDLRLTCCEY